MALPVEEIKKLITSSIPDASIEIKDLMGDNNHYSAIIKSKMFNCSQNIGRFRRTGRNRNTAYNKGLNCPKLK